MNTQAWPSTSAMECTLAYRRNGAGLLNTLSMLTPSMTNWRRKSQMDSPQVIYKQSCKDNMNISAPETGLYHYLILIKNVCEYVQTKCFTKTMSDRVFQRYFESINIINTLYFMCCDIVSLNNTFVFSSTSLYIFYQDVKCKH